MDSATENAIGLMRILQRTLSKSGRVELWERIKEGYCCDCGTELEIKPREVNVITIPPMYEVCICKRNEKVDAIKLTPSKTAQA